MGGVFSESDDDDGKGFGEHRRSNPAKTAPSPKPNISRSLDELSKTIEGWQTIIANMRNQQMPDKQAQVYLYQEMVETRNRLNEVIDCLSPTFVSYIESCETIAPSSQKQNELVPEKPKIPESPGIGTLTRRVQEYKDKSVAYKKIHDDLVMKYVDLEAQSKRIEQERNEILLRLSKMTSEILTRNNANISDLSDSNRPVKLGEMLSELYDNEWTDAFEALQEQGGDDRRSIRILFETLMDIFQFCKSRRSDLFEITQKETDVARLKRGEIFEIGTTVRRQFHFRNVNPHTDLQRHE